MASGGPKDAPGEIVEKIMSISRREFETGLERLTGAPPRPSGPDRYDVAVDAGRTLNFSFRFEVLPDAVLGKLVVLPRARVTLDLGQLPPDARAGFLALFDRTFQRGGG